ncbi:hypothetical protein [Desulfogranum japonicum]|uniref:hypothetical protein n=1 Tax=Desulfogranum japonicum TaxID=231447 RepID=UPI000684B065|nr:hypothetical protein [Desulfogranum japonicum]
MKSKFSVDFFSDERYEYVTAEISYEGQILCQISQDKGKSNMLIEFFHEQRVLAKQPKMKFFVNDFLLLIEGVKNDLATYR